MLRTVPVTQDGPCLAARHVGTRNLVDSDVVARGGLAWVGLWRDAATSRSCG